ncbi:hypothetical protein A7A08_03119 [Methyloligella halotolerans]|uniref:Uncharacterized protein n=1 Tax=Methyloligella halotolerans TaxID=1177755 RepID=A0A1E2RUP4_9HYPH|nr:hypothetical protein A7A08_03119 [Methyloligella halotolerans]
MPLISEPTEKPRALQGLAGLRRFWPLALLAAAGVGVYLMGWHRYLTFRELAESEMRFTTCWRAIGC